MFIHVIAEGKANCRADNYRWHGDFLLNISGVLSLIAVYEYR